MAIPEWYTGTDTTGRVAAGIEAIIDRMDSRTADQSDIEELRALLKLETETNWACHPDLAGVGRGLQGLSREL